MTTRLGQLEDAHLYAGYEVEDTAIGYVLAHRDEVEEEAADGCPTALALLAAVSEFFETYEALDAAEVNEQFAALTAEIDNDNESRKKDAA